jgi:hypothetical protein
MHTFFPIQKRSHAVFTGGTECHDSCVGLWHQAPLVFHRWLVCDRAGLWEEGRTLLVLIIPLMVGARTTEPSSVSHGFSFLFVPFRCRSGNWDWLEDRERRMLWRRFLYLSAIAPSTIGHTHEQVASPKLGTPPLSQDVAVVACCNCCCYAVDPCSTRILLPQALYSALCALGGRVVRVVPGMGLNTSRALGLL